MEGGISLETPQPKWASSRIEGRISWFFTRCGSKLVVLLSYEWDLRDPLLGASFSLHVRCEGPLGIPPQSLP